MPFMMSERADFQDYVFLEQTFQEIEEAKGVKDRLFSFLGVR